MTDVYKKLYRYEPPTKVEKKRDPEKKAAWKHYGWVCSRCSDQFKKSTDFTEHETRCRGLHSPLQSQKYTSLKNRTQKLLKKNHADTTNTTQQ